jgi:KDO2-lipid IV(A) lauroyltransferase
MLSLLPMAALYILSDIFYVLIYRVFAYRRRIVLGNLNLAFPEKTEVERIIIAKKFYRLFIDSFIETIKLISCDEKFLRKHFSVNVDLFDALHQQGKSCQLHLGHNFNWEWGNAFLPAVVQQIPAVVYMPIAHKAMDRLYLKLRSRWGSTMVPATPTEAFRTKTRELKHEEFVLVLVADQSPGDPSNAYWLNFFNAPTAFVTGPDKNARLSKLPVIFALIRRIKRGVYETNSRLITTDPRSLNEGELTVMFARFLEEAIREQPENWLWSHRRWKRDWKAEYANLWIDDPGQMPNAQLATGNRQPTNSDLADT